MTVLGSVIASVADILDPSEPQHSNLEVDMNTIKTDLKSIDENIVTGFSNLEKTTTAGFSNLEKTTTAGFSNLEVSLNF